MTSGGIEHVFLANRAALIRFLGARGAADAEDVVQELWLKLTTTPPSGPVREPLAYLYRMADNLMIDRARSRQRQLRRDESWQDAAVVAAPDAERHLVDRERLDRVERALAGLPERTTAIFRKFRLEGVRQQQIAADTGLSLSAVEKHLQKAYRVLIEVREAEAAEDGEPRRLFSEGARDAAE